MVSLSLVLKPWDIAAGELIVKEAGGVVVDARGGNDSFDNGQVICLLIENNVKTIDAGSCSSLGRSCKINL